MAHVTEMYRVINFALEMKALGLDMVPTFKDGIWKLEALSVSDYANDKENMIQCLWIHNLFLWCPSCMEK